jgi:hypothetical protein
MVLGIGAVVAVPVVVTDEATLGLAARIDVMATAATAPILRTERIMAPTVSSRGRVRRLVEMTTATFR